MFLFTIIQVIQDAVETLFEEYKDMMKHLAYSILKDYQFAEDAVQEALLSLSRNMDKIDNIHSNRSKNYVYTVIKSKSCSMYEKMNRENEKHVQFYDGEEVNNIEGDLDVKAFCNEHGFSDEVMEMLSNLDEVDKDILIYKYGAGYSGKEIAKLIGEEPDFVYKRLQRAIKKLQKNSKEKGNEQ